MRVPDTDCLTDCVVSPLSLHSHTAPFLPFLPSRHWGADVSLLLFSRSAGIRSDGGNLTRLNSRVHIFYYLIPPFESTAPSLVISAVIG